MDGSTVSANMAWGSGGGIYNEAGTATADGSTISANTAYCGGGIYNAATLTVTNSIIGGAGAGNQADQRGGGIYNASSGTTMVDGSTVSGNTAGDGGGIYNWGTLDVQNGSTIGGFGAGNQVTGWGGGIYNYDGTTTVTGSRILNNTAPDGGGVFNTRDAFEATKVTGSCIAGNSTTSFLNSQGALQTATGN